MKEKNPKLLAALQEKHRLDEAKARKNASTTVDFEAGRKATRLYRQDLARTLDYLIAKGFVLDSDAGYAVAAFVQFRHPYYGVMAKSDLEDRAKKPSKNATQATEDSRRESVENEKLFGDGKDDKSKDVWKVHNEEKEEQEKARKNLETMRLESLYGNYTKSAKSLAAELSRQGRDAYDENSVDENNERTWTAEENAWMDSYEDRNTISYQQTNSIVPDFNSIPREELFNALVRGANLDEKILKVINGEKGATLTDEEMVSIAQVVYKSGASLSAETNDTIWKMITAYENSKKKNIKIESDTDARAILGELFEDYRSLTLEYGDVVAYERNEVAEVARIKNLVASYSTPYNVAYNTDLARYAYETRVEQNENAGSTVKGQEQIKKRLDRLSNSLTAKINSPDKHRVRLKLKDKLDKIKPWDISKRNIVWDIYNSVNAVYTKDGDGSLWTRETYWATLQSIFTPSELDALEELVAFHENFYFQVDIPDGGLEQDILARARELASPNRHIDLKNVPIEANGLRKAYQDGKIALQIGWTGEDPNLSKTHGLYGGATREERQALYEVPVSILRATNEIYKEQFKKLLDLPSYKNIRNDILDSLDESREKGTAVKRKGVSTVKRIEREIVLLEEKIETKQKENAEVYEKMKEVQREADELSETAKSVAQKNKDEKTDIWKKLNKSNNAIVKAEEGVDKLQKEVKEGEKRIEELKKNAYETAYESKLKVPGVDGRPYSTQRSKPYQDVVDGIIDDNLYSRVAETKDNVSAVEAIKRRVGHILKEREDLVAEIASKNEQLAEQRAAFKKQKTEHANMASKAPWVKVGERAEEKKAQAEKLREQHKKGGEELRELEIAKEKLQKINPRENVKDNEKASNMRETASKFWNFLVANEEINKVMNIARQGVVPDQYQLSQAINAFNQIKWRNKEEQSQALSVIINTMTLPLDGRGIDPLRASYVADQMALLLSNPYEFVFRENIKGIDNSDEAALRLWKRVVDTVINPKVKEELNEISPNNVNPNGEDVYTRTIIRPTKTEEFHRLSNLLKGLVSGGKTGDIKRAISYVNIRAMQDISAINGIISYVRAGMITPDAATAAIISGVNETIPFYMDMGELQKKNALVKAGKKVTADVMQSYVELKNPAYEYAARVLSLLEDHSIRPVGKERGSLVPDFNAIEGGNVNGQQTETTGVGGTQDRKYVRNNGKTDRGSSEGNGDYSGRSSGPRGYERDIQRLGELRVPGRGSKSVYDTDYKGASEYTDARLRQDMKHTPPAKIIDAIYKEIDRLWIDGRDAVISYAKAFGLGPGQVIWDKKRPVSKKLDGYHVWGVSGIYLTPRSGTGFAGRAFVHELVHDMVDTALCANEGKQVLQGLAWELAQKEGSVSEERIDYQSVEEIQQQIVDIQRDSSLKLGQRVQKMADIIVSCVDGGAFSVEEIFSCDTTLSASALQEFIAYNATPDENDEGENRNIVLTTIGDIFKRDPSVINKRKAVTEELIDEPVTSDTLPLSDVLADMGVRNFDYLGYGEANAWMGDRFRAAKVSYTRDDFDKAFGNARLVYVYDPTSSTKLRPAFLEIKGKEDKAFMGAYGDVLEEHGITVVFTADGKIPLTKPTYACVGAPETQQEFERYSPIRKLGEVAKDMLSRNNDDPPVIMGTSTGRIKGYAWKRWVQDPKDLLMKVFPDLTPMVKDTYRANDTENTLQRRYIEKLDKIFTHQTKIAGKTVKTTKNEELYKAFNSLAGEVDKLGREFYQPVSSMSQDGKVDGAYVVSPDDIFVTVSDKASIDEAKEQAKAEGKTNTVEYFNRDLGKFVFIASKEQLKKYENGEAVYRRAKKLSERYAMQKGYTPETWKAYVEARKVMEEIWANTKKSQGAAGITEENQIKFLFGYIPHFHDRFGIYELVDGTQSEGKAVYRCVESKQNLQEAKRLAKSLQSHGRRVVVLERGNNHNDPAADGGYATDVEELPDTLVKEIMEKGTYIDGFKAEELLGPKGKLKEIIVGQLEKAMAINGDPEIGKKEFLQFFTQGAVGDKDYLLAQDALRQYPPNELFKKRTHMKISEIIDAVNKMGGKYRSFGQSRHRLGAGGYNRDFVDGVYRYALSSARYQAWNPHLARWSRKYEEMFGHGYGMQPRSDAERLVKEWLDRAYGRPKAVDVALNRIFSELPIIGKLADKYGDNFATDFLIANNQMMAMLKLGLRPSAAIAQLGSLLNVAAVYSKSDMAYGFKMATKPTETMKKLFEELNFGTRVQGLGSEVMDYQGSIYDNKLFGKRLNSGKSLGDIVDLSLRMVEFGDSYCRKIVAAIEYTKARRAGLSHYEAVDKARLQVINIVFDNGRFDEQGMFSDFGVLGKTVMQFKKYPLKQWNLLMRMNEKQRAKYLVALSLAGGVFGFPFAELIAGLSLAAVGGDGDDEDFIEYTKRMMMDWAGKDPYKQVVAEIAMYGLPSQLGVDFSQSLSLGGIIPTDDTSLWGPTWSTYRDIYKALVNLDTMSDKVIGVGAALSPAFWNVYQGAEGHQHTKRNIKPVRKYDAYERLLKGVLSIRPVNDSLRNQANYAKWQADMEYDTERKRAINAYLLHKNKRNFDRLAEFGIDKKGIKRIEADRKRRAKAADKRGKEPISKLKGKEREHREKQEVYNMYL